MKMRPEDAAAYIILGQSKELVGNDSEALQACTEAKRLHTEYAATMKDLAGCTGAQGNSKNHLRRLRKRSGWRESRPNIILK
jgi:predicted Zn-dependent protease